MMKQFLALALALSTLASCASQQATRTTQTQRLPEALDESYGQIQSLLRWLNSSSRAAAALSVKGDIAVKTADMDQSATFSMRSKRLIRTGNSSSRVDSLGLEVKGPFGITVARFNASPTSFVMYNGLSGEVVEGKPEDSPLQQMMGLGKFSIGILNDVAYGLPPGVDLLSPQDSLKLYARGDGRYVLLIHRALDTATEAVSFSGKLPTSENDPTALEITKYDRWLGWIDDLDSSTPKEDISIRFERRDLSNGINMPRTIRVTGAGNSLSMTFTSIDANPENLVTQFKIPRK